VTNALFPANCRFMSAKRLSNFAFARFQSALSGQANWK
jgi:hypothetical protein